MLMHEKTCVIPIFSRVSCTKLSEYMNTLSIKSIRREKFRNSESNFKQKQPIIALYFESETVLKFYQLPLILTELFQHDLINFSYLMACYLYQVMMTLHFLNDVAYDAESTQTSKLRHNRFEECSTMGKLINRIPGSRLLISSLPGSALRTHVESLGKPRDVNMLSQSLT